MFMRAQVLLSSAASAQLGGWHVHVCSRRGYPRKKCWLSACSQLREEAQHLTSSYLLRSAERPVSTRAQVLSSSESSASQVVSCQPLAGCTGVSSPLGAALQRQALGEDAC